VIKLSLISSEEAYIYLLGLEVSSTLSEAAKIEYYMNQLAKFELTEDQEKEYLYWQAKLFIEKGEVENAKVTLEKLLSLDKFNPKYHFLLSKVKIKETDVEGAKMSLEKCIECDLDNVVTEEALQLLSNLK
jgi:predicted Zn-dependent protease